ncbi:MAG TPA: hypothetical protein PL141_11785 [Thermoflexales bacterium]|nr:hypothetical protein [Thermoflexales bacterium]HQW35510.1 hypothetical protein [Thermoflexales bacterium]
MPRVHTTISKTDSTSRFRAASVDCGQTAPRTKAPYKKRDDSAVLVNRDLQRHAEKLYDALAMVATAFEDTPTKQLTSDQRAALYHASLLLNPDKQNK